MADEKKFNGFTVSELESRVKKYGLEICMCVTFILSAIFTLAWGGSMLLWSILLCMILAVIGAIFPKPVKRAFHSTLEFIYKERVTSIAAAVISILASIFLPVIIFALVGLIAGKSIALHASACCSTSSEK